MGRNSVVWALLAAAALCSACTMKPLVDSSRTTMTVAQLGELECRRDVPAGSSIPRSMCATPDNWAAFDKRQSEIAQGFLDNVLDNQDNRVLYRNMRPND